MKHAHASDEDSGVRRPRGDKAPPHAPAADGVETPAQADYGKILMGGLEGMLSVLIRNGKNYLGPIKGYASLIQDDTDEASNTRRWADKIMRNVRVMEDHFNSLDMYRIKGALGVAEVSWHLLVSEVMDHFAAVNVKGVPIEIANETRGTFRQHGELLKRVLVHLVVNAYESIERAGKVDLTILPHSDTDDGRRRVAIRVADSGRGMDGETTKRIWIPFYTTKRHHVGLGLPYVATAAALMKMEVEVVSTLGGGTVVNLVLTEEGG
jgi:signal transduction histidine kinase